MRVYKIAIALNMISRPHLFQKFMPEALKHADIYRSIWHKGEAFKYLYAYFIKLQKLYSTALNKKLAVIT